MHGCSSAGATHARSASTAPGKELDADARHHSRSGFCDRRSRRFPVTDHTGGRAGPPPRTQENHDVPFHHRSGRAALAAVAVSSLTLLAACGGDTQPAAGSDSDSGSDAATPRPSSSRRSALQIPAMKELSEGVQALRREQGLRGHRPGPEPRPAEAGHRPAERHRDAARPPASGRSPSPRRRWPRWSRRRRTRASR